MKIGRVISIVGNMNPFSRSGISFDVPAPLLRINESRESRVPFKLMRCKQISKNGVSKFKECLSMIPQCILENAC